jgi:hypothetical protein
MGMTINLDCTSCSLHAEDLDVGSGRDRSDGPFESRVFWCPKCENLGSRVVLEPVDRVREMIDGIATRGHRWAGAPERVEMSYEDFVAALLQAHLWPRCGCGGRYKAVQLAEPSSEKARSRCPRCKERTLKSTATIMWD